jgi:hypothetical protein
MYRSLRTPPGVIRGAQRASLVREGDREVMTALGAAGTGEAAGENAAGPSSGGNPVPRRLAHAGHLVVFTCRREVGLQVLLHDLVKSGLLGTATAARARSIPVAPTPLAGRSARGVRQSDQGHGRRQGHGGAGLEQRPHRAAGGVGGLPAAVVRRGPISGQRSVFSRAGRKPIPSDTPAHWRDSA